MKKFYFYGMLAVVLMGGAYLFLKKDTTLVAVETDHELELNSDSEAPGDVEADGEDSNAAPIASANPMDISAVEKPKAQDSKSKAPIPATDDAIAKEANLAVKMGVITKDQMGAYIHERRVVASEDARRLEDQMTESLDEETN